MILFSGFPAGKLQVTPLPNLFFTELVPAINDLAELKLTLYLFWLFSQKKRQAPFASLAELRGDSILVESLGFAKEGAGAALEQAVRRAIERGTLLPFDYPAEGRQEELVFLNSEAGRRALERAQAGELKELPGQTAPETATAVNRPNIFVLYEKNIGVITPMIADELKDAEKQYPAEWIENAIRISVENNKRSWSYVRAILERWQAEGPGEDGKKGKPWYGDEYAKFVRR